MKRTNFFSSFSFFDQHLHPLRSLLPLTAFPSPAMSMRIVFIRLCLRSVISFTADIISIFLRVPLIS